MSSLQYVKGNPLTGFKATNSNRFDQERLEYPVSPACPAIAPPSPCRPGSSILIDGHSEGLLTEKQAHHGKEFTKGGRCTYIFAQQPAPTVDCCDVAQVTIDMLPNVALLEIFDLYVDEAWTRGWYALVHVCRKWRDIVFGSPRRLKLRLYCTNRTPVREMLYIWPALPIVLMTQPRADGADYDPDNTIAALEHKDRICQFIFHKFPRSLFEKILAETQQTFPALTHLVLVPGYTLPALPDSFLGGSAPQLQTVSLDRIPFPGLPNLLLSATHLVHLDLHDIPHSGYFSPEAIFTCLSASTSLKRLYIGFKSSQSRPDQNSRHPPPPTRTLLPVLTYFKFKGASEYLEILVARIDAPLLAWLYITFFHQVIFDTPQLAQFVDRTPKFKAYDEVQVIFSRWDVRVIGPRGFGRLGRELQLGISCGRPDWQLLSVVQVCGSSFPQAFISIVEHLYIEWRDPEHILQEVWQDDIENSQWLELLHTFTTVKHLYISGGFVPHIVPALQDPSGERVTEVLPNLQSLFLGTHFSENTQERIRQFVSARKLAGHPIAVSDW